VLIVPTSVEDQINAAQASAHLNNGAKDTTAISVPTKGYPQFTGDPFMDDIFSFDMDCINDAWLNQYLPDLDFSESFAAF
jgi:hypothetical protein